MMDGLIGKKNNFRFGVSTEVGFSTLEVLIAMAIIVTTLTAVILVVFGNQTVAVDNQLNNGGLFAANDLIENARSQSSINFNALTSASSSDDMYKKELLVSDVNPCKKNGDSIVTWNFDTTRPQKIEIKTTFANLDEAIGLGGDCGPDGPPPTSFQNIVCDDHDATFDFSPSGIPATGVDLINRGGDKYTVISADGSSAGQDDLWIVRVNNRTTMQTKVSSLDIGSGLNDVDAAGNFAFAANNATSKQLIVVDISDLSFPDVVASVSLNGAVANNSEAQRVAYYKNKVYIGTKYTGINGRDEFQVFDVTDPVNPTFSGSYNANHNIYSIIVRDQVISGVVHTIAYLAVSSTSSMAPELMVLDVTDPSAITLSGPGFNAPGFNQYGTALYALGDHLYFGRQRGTGSNYDLFSLDVADPAAISVLDSALLNLNPNKEIRRIIVSGPLMFLSTSDANKEGFQVWNVSSPKNISSVTKCNYPQEALDMEFDGNYVYVVNRSQKALRVIYDSLNLFP